jgi:hypothetical protein
MKKPWRQILIAVAVATIAMASSVCFAADKGGLSFAPAFDFQSIASAFPDNPAGRDCGNSGSAPLPYSDVSFRAVPLGLAMADFTGDSHPDLATVGFDRLDSKNAYYVIEITLSEGGRQSLVFAAPPGGLLLTPKDVTGDGNVDLVVRSAVSRLPIAVFLNDGCGHFSIRGSGHSTDAIRGLFSSTELTIQHHDYQTPGAALISRAALRRSRASCFAFWQELAWHMGTTQAACEQRVALHSGRAPPVL